LGQKRNAYRISVGKPAGKGPPGRPRRRWEDNFKIDFREMGWVGMDSIDLAQGRDKWRAPVKTVLYLRVPYNPGKFLRIFTIGGFSRRAQLHERVTYILG
jgi:hypothetical protein